MSCLLEAGWGMQKIPEMSILELEVAEEVLSMELRKKEIQVGAVGR